MTEDLRLRVLTEGDTRGLDKTARGLDDLADKADHAGRSTKGLGDEADKTSKKTESLGRSSKRTSHEVVDLDNRIVELKSSLKALNEQYEKSGKLDRRKFGTDSRELSSLQRLKKQLESLTDETGRFDKVLGSTLGKLPGLLGNVPGLGGLGGLAGNPAAGAVAAPVVAGAVINAGALAGGLTTAGIGAGVAGAGIAGAAVQSQAVRDEWTKTTGQIKAQFLAATTSFEQPTVAAVKRLGAAVQGIHMDKIFVDAAKFVEPLSVGAAKFVGSIGRGVEAIVSKGGPAIQATGDLIADVGDATEHALETIAGGSEGGAKAIRDLGGALSATVEDIGYFVRGTEDAYNALDSFRRKAEEVHPFIGLMYDIKGTDKVGVLSDTLDHAKDSAKGLSGALSDMSSEAGLANAAFDRMFGTMMDVDTANLQVKLGLAGLRDAMKDDGVTRDEMAEKVLRQIRLLEDQRQAQLATGDGSQAATDKINANYQSQLEQLKKMFPWLDGLISKYEDLAKPLTKHIDIVISEKRIGNVSGEGVISGGDQRRNAGKAYASGTPSAPRGWALVGEDGPELVSFAGGERVHTAAETAAMLAGPGSLGPAGSGGGQPTVINLYADSQLLRTVLINGAQNRGQTVAQYLGV